ncbi:MAG: transposase [Fibrobacteraceae bacterium]|nr:transposase [Fibrobacteraceae bacterium]
MPACTSWNCKYHVVFASKFKQKAFFGDKRREALGMLRGSANGNKSIFSRPSSAFDLVHTILEMLPKVSFPSIQIQEQKILVPSMLCKNTAPQR